MDAIDTAPPEKRGQVAAELARRSAMKHPDYLFKITGEVEIRPDLHRRRVVLSCCTEDGKSLHLEADYQALERIHQEIQKQLAV